MTLTPQPADACVAGLGGTMQILEAGGKHFYEFDYTLGDRRVPPRDYSAGV